MKQLLKSTLILMVFVCSMVSCTKEEIQTQIDGQTTLYKVVLDIDHTNYDGVQTKADYQWPDGAKLYIHFSNRENTKTYPGIATYSKATDSWTIPAPQGELHMGDSTKCQVIYINKEIEGQIINLNTDDVIYEDASAKYFLGSEVLTIKANLSPKTARIRFKGTAGNTIKLYGIAHYNKYNPNYNTFGTTTQELELTVGQDGYTPYIHPFFPNTAKRLEVTDNNSNIFVFKCSNEHLKAGISRFFTIPTPEVKHGWTMHKPIETFKIKDVEFNMIYVQWIEGSFYIAETETTQKLWQAVMNINPSLHWSDKLELPVENISAENTTEFITAINNKTGYSFNFPTTAQWLFAAQGGNKSKGYKYSGSNNIDEVAWYNANSSDSTHVVKTKLPNELGIYDMSGNVHERINGNHDFCGGSSFYDETWCNIQTEHFVTTYSGDSEKGRGFRLCLNI